MGSQCSSTTVSRVCLSRPSAKKPDKMKYLVVLVVVLGFACGSEEESTLNEVEVDFSDDLGLEETGRQTTLDPALLIGNVISALGNLNITDPNSIVQDILDALKIGGGTTATVGSLAGLGGIKTLFDAIVTGILGLISVPVGIANMILSLVGLVVLIIFLIDGGDFGSLLGVARSSSAWHLADFMPSEENLGVASDMFYQAKDFYDNLNL